MRGLPGLFYDSARPASWQESEWKPGESWKLMIPDGRIADRGEVLEIEPERRLVLSRRNECMPELRAEGVSRRTHELEKHHALRRSRGRATRRFPLAFRLSLRRCFRTVCTLRSS